MDLDFDLDDDKIKSFLQNKLEEMKSKNKKLEDTLNERRKFLRELTESCNMQMDESNVKITPKVWKKIFNNKYSIGVTIVNEDSTCLHNIKILLSWNSTSPLVYQVNIYDDNNDLSTKKSTIVCGEESCNSITDSLKKSDKIDQLGLLIVTLDQPKFIDKISYTVSGNIIFRQDEKEVTLAFPFVEISSMDAVDHELNEFLPSKRDVKDILTIISSMEQTDLVIIFPREWNSSLDSTFEILCSLRRIDVSSSCKQFYVTYKLSPSLDDSLVEIHAPSKADPKVSYVSIYSRNEGCLFSLLHHLHRNIPGVVIIPRTLYENYLLQYSDRISEAREDVEKFNECADKEIKFVKNFQQRCQSIQTTDSSDVVKFRSDLADLEKNTDIIYQRICQISNK